MVRETQGDKQEQNKTTEGINMNNLMEMLQEALKKQSTEDRKDNETLQQQLKAVSYTHLQSVYLSNLMITKITCFLGGIMLRDIFTMP